MKNSSNILLVGVGPHAQRFYLPSFASLARQYDVRLKAVVEIHGNEEHVKFHLSELRLDAEILCVQPFSEEMPEDVAAKLKMLIERLQIGAVIIATDPLSHKSYAIWAVSSGLHVLLDKPITSRRDAVNCTEQAKGIETDYFDLAKAYRDLIQKEPRAFIVCAHRRYHPGIQAVIDRIRMVSSQTGCPVTAIHAHHSDGQWRLPNEMVTQDHHSYHQGHGKASHSGHHFFDCIYRFFQAGITPGKEPDAFRVYASFVQPHGHLMQLTQEDYARLFGSDYQRVRQWTDLELFSLFQHYGELDIAAVITFLKKSIPVCLSSVELLHNGFSRRSSVIPGKDLYKGNGRVKHEQHRIHVGPFFAAHIHSYQAKDNHYRSSKVDQEPGGNNHFQITYFNNSEMLPGTNPVEHYNLTDLATFDETRLHIEEVKEGVVREFFQCLCGQADPLHSRSSLLDHLVPIQMLSGVYRSHVQTLQNQDPTVLFPFLPEASSHAC